LVQFVARKHRTDWSGRPRSLAPAHR
jgi:hypothetical protein